MTGRDDWFPLGGDEHAAQVSALVRLLSGGARRVLDLGAGGGRVALPLAEAGHSVRAVDRDESAARACAGLHPRVEACLGDFLAPDAGVLDGEFDAAVCLGHTFMLVSRVDEAVALLRRLRGSVRAGGVLAVDDIASLWEEVASGNWASGVSEDGSTELSWSEGDCVFTLRRVSGSVREPAAPLRLWCMGSLALLAEAAGWGPPERRAADGLILFTRPG